MRTLTSILAALSLLACAGLPASAQRRGPRGAAPSSSTTPPAAKSPAEKKILDTLDEAVRKGEMYANVPAADGRMLRILAESVGAKNVVEIGTSTGLSGLWFSMALQKTGGRLTTFELDPDRAATARAHFRAAGVESLVTVVEGDAHKNLSRVKDPVDVVFIDAEKDGYLDYLNQMLPRMRPGGLILAHNVPMVPEYMRAVNANSDLDTVIYSEGEGLAISLKKR